MGWGEVVPPTPLTPCVFDRSAFAAGSVCVRCPSNGQPSHGTQIPPERVSCALYYLDKVGACSHVEDLTYEFSQTYISAVVDTESKLISKSVDDTLSHEDDEHLQELGQTTLDTGFSASDNAAMANGGTVEDFLVDEDGETDEDNSDEDEDEGAGHSSQ